MELLVTALIMLLYTVLISFGWGRRMDYSPSGRPILAAVGFLIIIGGYSWSKGSMAVFQELVLWFIVGCFCILIRGWIMAAKDQDEATVKRSRGELIAEIERHNVADLLND